MQAFLVPKGYEKMTEKQLLKQLKILISIHGSAVVAASLGFRDGKTVKRWVDQNRIPEIRLDKVRHIVESASRVEKKGFSLNG